MSPIATWIQAIGSAGSLLGFVAYIWVMLLNRQDEGQVRREEEARGVVTWTDRGRRYDRDEDYVVCVHNGGTSPVFNCEVGFETSEQLPDAGEVHLHIVPPQVTAIRPVPFRTEGFDDEESLLSAAAVPVLRFTDSFGSHWRRTRNGILERLDRRRVRRRPRIRRARDDETWQHARS